MQKQGGKNTCKGGLCVDAQQMLLVFMIVLGCIILILASVLLGMQLVKREASLAESKTDEISGEYIEELHTLRFEPIASFSYISDDSATNGSVFLEGGIVGQAEYQVIGSVDTAAKIIELARTKLAETPDFGALEALDDDYYASGSVIAVAYEAPGLETFSVNKLSRDENHQVTAVAKAKTNPTTANMAGQLVFVKVDNVQPKTIELDITQE